MVGNDVQQFLLHLYDKSDLPMQIWSVIQVQEKDQAPKRKQHKNRKITTVHI